MADTWATGHTVETVCTIFPSQIFHAILTYDPSDKVTQVMQDFAPEGFQNRAPGRKVIHRTPLVSLGPNEEWSMDGHDKLAKAGFGIYGIRDKWGSLWLHYRVLPSNRYAVVIAIVILECIKKIGSESSTLNC